jgi:RNA polymerase sigma-70 factor (ECF subfamily)
LGRLSTMLEEVLDIGLDTTTQLPPIELTDEAIDSDEQLVRAVLDGDSRAFELIFERNRRMVARVISRFFRDRGEIEEFAQQTFTKAYFSLKNFRGGRGDSLPAWLTRIAVNVCYDEFRRRQRVSEVSISDGDDDAGIENIPNDKLIASDDSLAAAEMAERILSTLDARDRVAMTLVYSEEYSLAEAAEVLGISSGNLKSRLFRCRNHIKQRFGHLFT